MLKEQFCEETAPTQAQIARHLHDPPEVREDITRAPWCFANDTDLSLWDFMEANPERGERWTTIMTGFASTLNGVDVQFLLQSWRWGSLPPGSTLVDVGGGQGVISRALLAHFPNLSCISQDLPHVVESAVLNLPKDTPESVRDRLVFEAHDFFKPQPIQHATIYLLRWILHDWPDKEAVKILRALVPVMKPSTILLLNDGIVPDYREWPSEDERIIRWVLASCRRM